MQYVKLPLLPKSEMRPQIASDERARYNCFFSCKNLNAVGLSIICYTIGIKICEVFIGREPT